MMMLHYMAVLNKQVEAQRAQPSQPSSLRQRFVTGTGASPPFPAGAGSRCQSWRSLLRHRASTSAPCSLSLVGGVNGYGTRPASIIDIGSPHRVWIDRRCHC